MAAIFNSIMYRSIKIYAIGPWISSIDLSLTSTTDQPKMTHNFVYINLLPFKCVSKILGFLVTWYTQRKSVFILPNKYFEITVYTFLKGHSGQCDQIRQFLKVLGDKFPYKSSPNIRWLLCLLLVSLGYFLFQHLVTLILGLISLSSS